MVFSVLHHHISTKYGNSQDPSDFEEALRILEGGYINIRDKSVSFINPSLRDYLSDYIDDLELLCDFAMAAQKADWAERVWEHVSTTKMWSKRKLARIAASFLSIAERFNNLPEVKELETEPRTWAFYDLCFAERVSLLLAWFSCTEEEHFSDLAYLLLERQAGQFGAWRDARRLVNLVSEIRRGEFVELDKPEAFIDKIEEVLIGILRGHIWPDDLENLLNEIDENKEHLSEDVGEAANAAMIDQIENVDSHVRDIDSEITLNDQIEAMKRFAPRLGIPDATLKRAITTVEDRIARINEQVESAKSPAFSSIPNREPEIFDDVALANLFAPLVNGLG